MYDKYKNMSKEDQFEALLGPEGTFNQGLIEVKDEISKKMLKLSFKDKPMELIGRICEPFGPYAWQYGIFRAMYYLESFKNLTLTIQGEKVKLFDNKIYTKPENFDNPDNLLYLVKDYGHLLMKSFVELKSNGSTILGYFVNESARTPDYSNLLSDSKEKYFLFESYNVHT